MNYSALFTILAAAVVVLGGIAALIKAIWNTATTLRDNTKATKELTLRMDENTHTVDGRFTDLASRLSAVEHELSLLRKDNRGR
jgi:hypothetical protein